MSLLTHDELWQLTQALPSACRQQIQAYSTLSHSFSLRRHCRILSQVEKYMLIDDELWQLTQAIISVQAANTYIQPPLSLFLSPLTLSHSFSQVDKSMLTDDELWQLTHALPLAFRQQIQAQPDNERLRRIQARKQQAKTLGQQMVVAPPGPRPHYTSTDIG